jgi:hypothetical protein
MFQTITEPNVSNILGADRPVSTVDFSEEGLTRRVPSSRLGVAAAAYEVNNLQAVTVGQVGSLPLLSGNDAPVQLHGDAICFHVQLVDKTGEGKRRIEIAGFAIDV